MSTQNLSPELFTNKIIDNNKLSTFFCKVFALAHTYDNPLLYDNTDNQRHDHLPVCLITLFLTFTFLYPSPNMYPTSLQVPI